MALLGRDRTICGGDYFPSAARTCRVCGRTGVAFLTDPRRRQDHYASSASRHPVGAVELLANNTGGVASAACLRMERCNRISPRRRDGLTSSNGPCWARVGDRSKPDWGIGHSFTGENRPRSWGASVPDDRLLIQSMRAFYCCTVCIVVIDAEKIDQFWSTYTLSRR
jgi:hypothetical protein